MFKRFIKNLKNQETVERKTRDIDPDEIFLDSSNLPDFNVHQFEGRIETPISIRTIILFGLSCAFVVIILLSKTWYLQVANGETYYDRSENNRLRHSLIFSQRGVIYDRNDVPLAWNIENESDPSFSLRKYAPIDGLAHTVGYLKYPMKDKYGFYYSDIFVGKDGVEEYYDDKLSGENGLKIVEIDALGKVQSESTVRPPKDGENLKLSIDSKLQSKLFEIIKNLSNQVGFSGGSAVILDVNTGDVVSMVSYPEYNSQVLTDGKDNDKISKYLNNQNRPFINRVTDGLYTPGSIVKPFMSIAALAENVIDQYTNIFSSGSLTVPNPYDPSRPTVFKDWKAHGYVDMREAIAVSSDVYFYEIGGGFEDQKGLGINLIKKYMNMFGFGEEIQNGFFSGPSGVVPDPEWKKENFDGDEWRVGNTYHTSIGQYGFQVTPMQAVIATASIANDGNILKPKILLEEKTESQKMDLSSEYFKVAREGMLQAVESGTASGINFSDFQIGAKTGTAELGQYKQFVNAWIVGFFPYENPKYAFTIVMEKGPVSNTLGGVYVARQFFEWLKVYASEYTK